MTSADPLSAWIRAHSFPLASTDDMAGDRSDLAPLLDIIGDARVVALGESMHRTHEFPALRGRILRFLVEHAGFTALVLESGFAEGVSVERWVRHGAGRLRSVLDDGITYHFGKCQEALDQITWMREQQVLASRSVRFYGMDLPDSAASALPAVDAALDVVDRVVPDYAQAARARMSAVRGYLPEDRSGLARAASAIHSYLALDANTRNELTAGINSIVERIRSKQLDYRDQGASREEVEFALRAAEVALGADAFLAAMVEGPSRTWSPANIRDATMADTVEWILEREERILIFAANGHIRKTPYLAPPFVSEPLSTVGQHLADRLGRDYRVIGTTFGGGQAWLHRPGPDDPPGHSSPFVEELPASRPESLDAAFTSAARGSFLVDLREAPAELDAIAGTHNGPEIELADIRTSFDAMIHVDRISPWHTWIDERGHWS